jgi:hypothetical protein
MQKYDVAHINEQGVDLIIVPLADDYEWKTDIQQRQIISGLQACANAAGLRGTVVPVWQAGGCMKFIAPTNWHSFFRSIDFNYIAMNINRELTCG